MDLVGGVLLIAGSTLILLSGVGVVRFADIYARMHAAAKAPTLGILLVGVGVVAIVQTAAAAIIVMLAVLLQLIAGPVGAHLIGRSVYDRLRPDLDDVDELATRADDETGLDSPVDPDDDG